MAPRRGEVWQVDLSPVRGHEQSLQRPAAVVSADIFNEGPAGLVVVVPFTRTARDIPLHVAVVPPEGGLRSGSFAMVEQVRSISTERLGRRHGMLSPGTIAAIEDRLQILLDLP